MDSLGGGWAHAAGKLEAQAGARQTGRRGSERPKARFSYRSLHCGHLIAGGALLALSAVPGSHALG